MKYKYAFFGPNYLIFIHVIRLKYILLEGMTVDVADTIFSKFGIQNASSLDKGKLKSYYIALVKKHHPDKGGKDMNMRYINAAYDVLKTADPEDNVAYGIPPGYKTYPKDPATKGMYTTKVKIDFRMSDDTFVDGGKCDRIDYLAIINKLRQDKIMFWTEPSNAYDMGKNRWIYPKVVVYGTSPEFAEAVARFSHLFKG